MEAYNEETNRFARYNVGYEKARQADAKHAVMMQSPVWSYVAALQHGHNMLNYVKQHIRNYQGILCKI